jgi:hypothetical protein
MPLLYLVVVVMKLKAKCMVSRLRFVDDDVPVN